MTDALFREDAYRRSCEATVLSSGPEGVVLDATVFYPLGGGQPGDTGWLRWQDDHALRVVNTLHAEDGHILHLADPDAVLPEPGTRVRAEIDWTRRYAHMRMHTCLHLLGAVLPYPVTGGNISAERSRLDLDMPGGADKEALTEAVNGLIAADRPVRAYWVDEAELDARPELVRTLSVSPPRGAGDVRLLEIPGVDIQPCGGTHVRRTAEIGPVVVTKIQKKGRQNRRVYIAFA
jgi:misacylated tRNA(Ala) deacylase